MGWEVASRFSSKVILITTLTALVALILFACGDTTETTAPAGPNPDPEPDPDPDPVLVLRSERDLTPGCYKWPPAPQEIPDGTGYAMPLGVGDTAIEFTLADIDGEKHTLSGLLATRPVLIIFGAYT